MFHLNESQDLAIAQIPRCGLTTMGEWLGRDFPVVPNDDVRLRSITRRVAFVRHPIDRLESAFSMFYWMSTNDRQRHVSNAPIDSWESFVDHVLDPDVTDDEHWKPQSAHVGNVPNLYHRLKDLRLKFEMYRPGILPHRHLTSRSPLIRENYRVAELGSKYADDIILYKETN